MGDRFSNISQATQLVKAEPTANARKIRNKAPPINVPAVLNNKELRNITLDEYHGRYVILLFYPMDFSFVCPTEVIAFSDRAREFRSMGCEVLACSTDSQNTHLAWINTPRKAGGLGELDIPLLADKSMKVARDYGVLDEETGLPERAIFIIDDNGLIRHVAINDAGVGRSVEEAVRQVQALKYTDEFGEVCPANWRPGHRSIIPKAEHAEAYFKLAM